MNKQIQREEYDSGSYTGDTHGMIRLLRIL